VKQAAAAILSLTKEYVIGERVTAIVTKITTFGAFAKLDEHHEGLIHISEIAPFRLGTMDGVLTEGEAIPVEVVKIEEGKIGLSIKKVNPDFASERELSAS
jgi:predicted RNA-binding protein with RPS1 domain